MPRSTQQFQTIRTEGALLPPDILQRIASLKTDGTRGEDYHLPEGFKINEAITQSWDILKKHWRSFQEKRETLAESDTGTNLTNERWLLPLFKELEYGRLATSDTPVIDERSFPIDRFYNNSPLHFIGCNLSLDKRTKGARGAATSSPHSMVQEFLNRSEPHLWAFLSNGRQLRILRDNVSMSRQAFVEFDLEGMFEGEVFEDFALLWLLCHQSRVESERIDDCWLEKWSKLAGEQGTRVLNDLRVGVRNAISALGAGFIGHKKNDQLRKKLKDATLTKDDYYRQLLRIVYRLLFLFVAEDRNLLHPPESDLPIGEEGQGEGETRTAPTAHETACDLYDTHYSTRRLRELAFNIRGSKHADLWHSLSLIFDRLNEQGCDKLALIGLGSFLWRPDSTVDLIGPMQSATVTNDETPAASPVYISNADLLKAIRALAYVEQDRVLRQVDYRNLGSEELGSVYESLLELHPIMEVDARSFELSTAAGNERKTTGSYYTPDSLVQCLLDSALDPVVENRLKEAKSITRKGANPDSFPDWFTVLPKETQRSSLDAGYHEVAQHALLTMKVCDPACGSGHFLIAAAHRMGRHLARVRTGESEPSPEDHQHALRDVIGRCIYGVDINPMAVELCKVSLWIEAIEPGKPLSFLDHHILCGNSLLGTTPALLAAGIPNDAFRPIEGDIKTLAARLKKSNKRERSEFAQEGDKFQRLMAFGEKYIQEGNLPAAFMKLSASKDDSAAEVLEKERLYASLVSGVNYQNARLLADTWCAVFVWKKDESDLGRLCPTEQAFRKIENNPHSILPHVRSEVRRLADQYQFFHWHLAFPNVFVLPEEAGTAENKQMGWSRGFDVVLGNPPWERTAFEEVPYFTTRAPEVAEAATTAERRRLIGELESKDPPVFKQYVEDKRKVVGEDSFYGVCGRFTLSAGGRTNTYALFCDNTLSITRPRGRSGLVIPTGIATDTPMQKFWNGLASQQCVESLFDFENRGVFFPNVHSSYKFCLLTLRGTGLPVTDTVYGFFLEGASHSRDASKTYSMAASELAIVNPNTRQPPVCRSRTDFLLLLRLQCASPPVAERCSAWVGLTSASTSDFWIDSTSNDDVDSVAMYESKLIHQFDHRFATYEGTNAEQRRRGQPRHLGLQERAPNIPVFHRFLIPQEIAARHLERKTRWNRGIVGYRDVARSTDERTFISSVVPFCGLMQPLNGLTANSAKDALEILSFTNSFPFDFAARLKTPGIHVNVTIANQLPSGPTLATIESLDRNFLANRVLELTYTAWDLEAFALDCGYDGPPFRWDEERRFLLRCELDAAYFHLYLGAAEAWGADNPELREMFPTPRDAVEYIMETFPIVRRKDIKRTAILDDDGEVTTEGTYITKDTILTIYDQMAEAITTGQPYQTKLNPPPGPPTDTEANFLPMAEWTDETWQTYASVIHQPRTESINEKLEQREEAGEAILYLRLLLKERGKPVQMEVFHLDLIFVLNTELRRRVLLDTPVEESDRSQLADNFLQQLNEQLYALQKNNVIKISSDSNREFVELENDLGLDTDLAQSMVPVVKEAIEATTKLAAGRDNSDFCKESFSDLNPYLKENELESTVSI
jgi:hypothetical protein